MVCNVGRNVGLLWNCDLNHWINKHMFWFMVCNVGRNVGLLWNKQKHVLIRGL